MFNSLKTWLAVRKLDQRLSQVEEETTLLQERFGRLEARWRARLSRNSELPPASATPCPDCSDEVRKVTLSAAPSLPLSSQTEAGSSADLRSPEMRQALRQRFAQRFRT